MGLITILCVSGMYKIILIMVEHLTEGQIGEFKKLFDEIDKNRDGKLTLEEIKEGCQALKIEISEDQLSQIMMMLKGVDKGIVEEEVIREGITFPEFLISMSKNNPDVYKLQDEIINAFKVFDHDGKGEISLTELKHILTTMGHKFTDEEVEEMFSAADISKQQFINYSEFVKNSFIN